MPSLEDILKKTKAKSEQHTTIRKPPSIASEDRPYSELNSQSATKPQQSSNKPTTNQQQSSNKVATPFFELVGLQRDLIIFIYSECKKSWSRISKPLTLKGMATPLKRSSGVVRTTIQRLEKKGCLIKVGFKNGRNGWSRYKLPDSIYNDVLMDETSNKVATE